ncbi:MAG: helix-turn-helix domain-containing protein [Bacillota bacterium]
MEIGNTLKAARESRGISLENVEEHTKIRRKYLEALENENFEILPGRVYIKGFIKNYARFLGLNANALVSAYEARAPLPEREDEFKENKLTSIEKRGSGSFVKIAIGLLAIALVAAFLYLPALTEINKPGPTGDGENKIAGDNKTIIPEVRTNQGNVPGKPPAQKGVNITLSVTNDECWMSVEIDGKPAFTGFLSAGQIKEFKGNEKISLRLGNAGVVEVEFNGQKMGVLGGVGQVVTKEFKAPQV